jgi:hypothetical protein
MRIKKMVLCCCKAMETKVQGGGSVELRTVDFPFAGGLLLFQVIREGVAAARRQHGLFFSICVGVL